ncbi:hypothetical protein ACFYU4_38035 [Streptomyces tendae]|uniref:hypothetical protein n=1 Tax=Streptomyces tendae TaxID=1932 RepID=UPI0036C3A155
MANDAAASEEAQDEQPAGPSLSDIGLVGALARLLDEVLVKKQIRPRIDGMKVPLLKAYETGQSEHVVRVGDDLIGRYKVNTVQPKVVVDPDNEAALTEYAEDHGGLEVIIRRNPTWEEALLKYAEYDEDTGKIIDTRTGEVVPGLKYEKGGGPTGGVTFTWEQRDVGKKRLTRHYQAGALDHLLTETPELMAGPRPVPAEDDAQR